MKAEEEIYLTDIINLENMEYVISNSAFLKFLLLICRITAYVSRKPSCISCPASGSHQWSFLGKNGREHYQCRKCRVQVKTATRPSSFGCPASGSHQWNQF